MFLDENNIYDVLFVQKLDVGFEGKKVYIENSEIFLYKEWNVGQFVEGNFITVKVIFIFGS